MWSHGRSQSFPGIHWSHSWLLPSLMLPLSQERALTLSATHKLPVWSRVLNAWTNKKKKIQVACVTSCLFWSCISLVYFRVSGGGSAVAGTHRGTSCSWERRAAVPASSFHWWATSREVERRRGEGAAWQRDWKRRGWPVSAPPALWCTFEATKCVELLQLLIIFCNNKQFCVLLCARPYSKKVWCFVCLCANLGRKLNN